MAYQTHDPYLKQQQTRYAPDDRNREVIHSTRTSVVSIIGIAAVAILALAAILALVLGPGATTEEVDVPATGPEATIEAPQPVTPGAQAPAVTAPEATAPAPETQTAPDAAAPDAAAPANR